jgi:hypothetical protein
MRDEHTEFIHLITPTPVIKRLSIYTDFETVTTSDRTFVRRPKKPSCDCTHTQACKECAESKDICWEIIEI